MPRSIDLLDFAGLALLSRTHSTFRAPVGVPHYLLIAVLDFEFDCATAIQTAARGWLVRTARYPTTVDLPQAYINRVVDREQELAAAIAAIQAIEVGQAQISFELAQAHNAPMITDSDDNDTVA